MALGAFTRRPLAALQVEVTSRCTRRCRICPRTPLAKVWHDGDLGDANWERLALDLRLAKHVHLQGWGEPLLHPRLPEMVDTAADAGCTVGLTTNADLLSEAIDWITAARVRRVVVSVAGDDSTHAELRDGSRLVDVWAAVKLLSKRRRHRRRPEVQVSYLLTQSNSAGLPDAVCSAAAAGADEIFAVHLDCTPSAEIAGETAFDATELKVNIASVLETARRVARSAGIAFRPPTRTPEDLLVCASDPLHCVYVGWDGRVGPCVNLGLPVSGTTPRWREGQCHHVEPALFGTLSELSLREILAGSSSRDFTSTFESRLAAERRMLDAVTGNSTIACIDDADRRRADELAANPFPAACASCHKVFGW